MIEDGLRVTDECGKDFCLDRLEADIWHAVAARARERRTLRQITFCQVAVMTGALFGSIATGIAFAGANAPGGRPFLALGVELTPSVLLLSAGK